VADLLLHFRFEGSTLIYTVIFATFAHWLTWKSLSPTMIKVESWTSIKISLMAYVLWTFGQVLGKYAPIAVHLLPSRPIGLTLHVTVCACTCQRSSLFITVFCEVLYTAAFCIESSVVILPTDCSSFCTGQDYVVIKGTRPRLSRGSDDAMIIASIWREALGLSNFNTKRHTV
jgi:hypothetical protein